MSALRYLLGYTGLIGIVENQSRPANLPRKVVVPKGKPPHPNNPESLGIWGFDGIRARGVWGFRKLRPKPLQHPDHNPKHPNRDYASTTFPVLAYVATILNRFPG